MAVRFRKLPFFLICKVGTRNGKCGLARHVPVGRAIRQVSRLNNPQSFPLNGLRVSRLGLFKQLNPSLLMWSYTPEQSESLFFNLPSQYIYPKKEINKVSGIKLSFTCQPTGKTLQFLLRPARARYGSFEYFVDKLSDDNRNVTRFIPHPFFHHFFF